LRISLRLNLKQAQPGAHHLTGVLVLSTFNERGDEFIVMVGEINVPGGHFRPQLQSILDSDERSGATNFWKRYPRLTKVAKFANSAVPPLYWLDRYPSIGVPANVPRRAADRDALGNDERPGG